VVPGVLVVAFAVESSVAAASVVGKRYAELVNVIPADLLKQWESE